MTNNFIRKSKLSFNLTRIIDILKLFFRDFINHIIFLILKIIIKKKTKYYQNTLILINSERMGDIFLSVDLIHSLISSNKYEKIYVVLQSHLIEILNELKIDCIPIPYNKNKYRYNIIYRYQVLNEINNLQSSMIINISPERGSLNDELSIIPQSNDKIALKLYSSYMSKYFIKKKNKYYSTFLSNNEKNVYKSYEDILSYLDVRKNAWKNNLIMNKNISHDYLIIAPSSSSSFRNWDKSKFREIVKYLSAKTKVYLIGTNEQKNLLQYIANYSINVEILINLELKKIIEILNYSKLFIGLDSGLSHLALLLNKKMIAIIGGGKYGQFFPYKNSKNVKYLFYQMNCFGCNWNCKYKIPHCIENVTVDNVIKAYEELNEIP